MSRRDGTTSLSHPIINTPNRKMVGVPALTHQDRPTETALPYVPFWFLYAEDRAQWPPVLRNMSQSCMFSSLSFEDEFSGAYCLSESDICENLIPYTIIQKSKIK